MGLKKGTMPPTPAAKATVVAFAYCTSPGAPDSPSRRTWRAYKLDRDPGGEHCMGPASSDSATLVRPIVHRRLRGRFTGPRPGLSTSSRSLLCSTTAWAIGATSFCIAGQRLFLCRLGAAGPPLISLQRRFRATIEMNRTAEPRAL